MPNIKISELTAPIAVTDSDILPVVQSSVTRKITWGALKSTLSGALGRTYLGLGTAAVANLTTSTTDTTAGRVTMVGDYGWGSDSPPDTDPDTVAYSGLFQAFNSSAMPTLGTWVGLNAIRDIGGRTLQLSCEDAPPQRLMYRVRLSTSAWQTWRDIWNSQGKNTITVDTGSIGYGTGSGATAVQPTSKATGVSLNKPSGQITTASGAIAANTAVSFTMTNNKIDANDIPKVVIKSGATAGAYVVQVDAVAAGSCRISIHNMTAGSLSETLVLQFNIEKGAIA